MKFNQHIKLIKLQQTYWYVHGYGDNTAKHAYKEQHFNEIKNDSLWKLENKKNLKKIKFTINLIKIIIYIEPWLNTC